MITRRDFLQALAVGAGLGAVGVSLAGCDDGGGGGDAGNGGGDAGSGGGEDAGTGGEDAGTGGEDAGTGGQDAGTEQDAGGEASCTPGAPTIAGNHGHSLTLPMADVEAGTEQTYDIQGASPHPHTITVTAADFTQLRETGSVTVTSSTNSGHDHAVTLTCA